MYDISPIIARCDVLTLSPSIMSHFSLRQLARVFSVVPAFNLTACKFFSMLCTWFLGVLAGNSNLGSRAVYGGKWKSLLTERASRVRRKHTNEENFFFTADHATPSLAKENLSFF